MDSLRMVTCALCTMIFYLCRRCDHGNRYCAKACRALARTRVLRLAQRTYRRTPDGRKRAAQRQTRFRDLRKQSRLQIVTHPTPPPVAAAVELLDSLHPVALATIVPQRDPELPHEERTSSDPAPSHPLSFGGHVARLAAAAQSAAVTSPPRPDGAAAAATGLGQVARSAGARCAVCNHHADFIRTATLARCRLGRARPRNAPGRAAERSGSPPAAAAAMSGGSPA